MDEQVAEQAAGSLAFDLLSADDLYVTLSTCLAAGDDQTRLSLPLSWLR